MIKSVQLGSDAIDALSDGFGIEHAVPMHVCTHMDVMHICVMHMSTMPNLNIIPLGPSWHAAKFEFYGNLASACITCQNIRAVI